MNFGREKTGSERFLYNRMTMDVRVEGVSRFIASRFIMLACCVLQSFKTTDS